MKKLNFIPYLFILIPFINSCNEAGNIKSSSDSDSLTIETISIGNQTWMLKSINSSKFNNGDIIEEASTKDEFRKLGKDHKSACIIINDSISNTSNTYYNWYAVNDPRGLAPNGWHIPSKDEIYVLVNELKKDEVGGIEKLKIILPWERWWTSSASAEHDADATSFIIGITKRHGVLLDFKNGSDKIKPFFVRCLKN